MRRGRVALAVVGAVIGAGFASGREIMRFFAQFGAWSWLGIAVAAGAMGYLAARLMTIASGVGAGSFAGLCTSLLGRWGGHVGMALYALLLLATGAAMLSGAGELADIMLPVRRAYEWGFLAMLLVGLLVAWRGVGGLAAVSAWLIPTCCVLYGLLMRLPPLAAGVLLPPWPQAWQAAPLALAYAALNMALAAGLLCESGGGLTPKERRGAALLSGLCLGALLALANGALLPSRGALQAAALPMVELAARLGKVGFWLSGATLALAMLSTLAAVLRACRVLLSPRVSENKAWLAVAVVCAGVGALGFDRLIGVVYPALGWAAAVLVLLLCWRGRRVQ